MFSHPPENAQPASSAEELYLRALDLIAGNDANGAVVLLRECLALDPAFLDAMHALIRALQDAGDLDSAIEVALHLASIDPEDPLAHTSLSILYQRKGWIAEAEAEGTKAKLLGWKRQLREARPSNLEL